MGGDWSVDILDVLYGKPYEFYPGNPIGDDDISSARVPFFRSIRQSAS
jgi:hypothetical protein